MSKVRRLAALGGGGLLLVALGVALNAQAQLPMESRKFQRNIATMENALSEVVVDSRNVLVPSHDCVHGVYVPGFGVLFTLEASLLGRDWDGYGRWFHRNEKGRIVIYRDDDDEDDEDRDDRRSLRERRRDREEKRYTEAKEELIDALLDYGDTLDELGANEWVGICVYLEDSDYFHDNKISRYIVKASIQDLKAYAANSLSRDAMTAKLVQEEY
jgi:hypothetical protein